jgi:hypothetical protein
LRHSDGAWQGATGTFISVKLVSVKSFGGPLLLAASIFASPLVGCSGDELSAQLSWCDAAVALLELEEENGASARLEDSGAEQRDRSARQTAASSVLVTSAPEDLEPGVSGALALIDDAYQRQHTVFEKYGFDRLRVLSEANLVEQNELLLTRSERVMEATERLLVVSSERCS